MNKNTASEYLSLKNIALISLIISIGFHIIMTLSFYFGDTLFSNYEITVMRPHFKIGRLLMFTFASFVMVFLIFVYNRKILSFSFKHKYYELTLLILGSAIIASVLCIGFVFTRAALSDPKPEADFLYNVMRNSLVRVMILTAVVILVVQLLKSQYNQKRIAVENEILRSENILTRFEALKNQLDPHFLFNSLHSAVAHHFRHGKSRGLSSAIVVGSSPYLAKQGDYKP